MKVAPLKGDGKYAALRRVPAKGNVRSNVQAKGTIEKVEVSDEARKIAEIVRPKLIKDGMFLVGLDFVGSDVLEFNVFTPGNSFSICDMLDADFAETILQG